MVSVKSLSSLHAKIYIADQNKAIVTSANLTLGGLLSNTEYGVFIRDHDLVNRIHRDVTSFLEKSEPISYEKLRKICKEIVEDPDFVPIRVPMVERMEIPEIHTPDSPQPAIVGPEDCGVDEDSHIVTEGEKEYFQKVDRDDGIGLYFHEAGRIPLLTPEEEIILAKRMKGGLAARELLENPRDDLSPEVISELAGEMEDGADAKEHLILANLRLVIHNANKHKNRGVPFLDLIQEGNIGLMRATEIIRITSLGNKFSTYATLWIRQAIRPR